MTFDKKNIILRTSFRIISVLIVFITIGCQDSNNVKNLIKKPQIHFQKENIYICMGHMKYSNKFYQKVVTFLEEYITAVKYKDGWILNDAKHKKTYIFQILFDIDSVKKALATKNAHVIIRGHANFGLGPIFCKNKQERYNQNITEKVKYIDDERLINVKSRWMGIPISSVRINNKLINWWPKYKDGTSGIAPYYITSSKSPPYNYYLTYQIPGDSSFYKILDSSGKPIERFPHSNASPWFNKNGQEPNPLNPSHQKYFIQNFQKKNHFFRRHGQWKESRRPKGFYGENFLFSEQTSESQTAEWEFEVPFNGTYEVYTWKHSNKNSSAQVLYSLSQKKCPKYESINRDNNQSPEKILLDEIIDNQKKNINCWSKLGRFRLEKGTHIMSLKNVVPGSSMIADAIRITHSDNPEDAFIPFFYSDKRRATVNEIVIFSSDSNGDIKNYTWDFGDGTKITKKKNYVFNQYKKPGFYDVSLEITDHNGNSKKISKTEYIAVDAHKKRLYPDFSGRPNSGQIPLTVKFTDRSLGKINTWHWDFGDGTTSVQQNPQHIFSKSDNYTITLTVIDEKGIKKKIVKERYIKAYVFDIVIDNTDYPLPHYENYTIIDGSRMKNESNNFQYKRLFFESCNVERYFLETFNHGVVFFTKGVSHSNGLLIYLYNYVNGKSDKEIIDALDEYQPKTYDFINFSKKPNIQTGLLSAIYPYPH